MFRQSYFILTDVSITDTETEGNHARASHMVDPSLQGLTVGAINGLEESDLVLCSGARFDTYAFSKVPLFNSKDTQV